MMQDASPLPHLHHITAIASGAQQTVDFYTHVLGLHLVKRTVNFDDPKSYHLYFACAPDGRPEKGRHRTLRPKVLPVHLLHRPRRASSRGAPRSSRVWNRYAGHLMGVGELRIRGVVRRGGEPVEGAYITLNQGEEFIAERRTGPDGFYEFHTTPGDWVLVCRGSGTEPVQLVISAPAGEYAADFDV